MQLPTKIKKILNIFKQENIDAYVVGGALRDLILGKKPNDFDIATPASPETIQTLFKNYHMVLIGAKHGTIGVFFQGMYIEITTFRKEEDYKDHRHPERVIFIDNLQDDLSRRDFTINALAYQDRIYDYFHGVEDISNKIIRTVGDPFLRFEEDGLRIIRALRFASTLDFVIETITEKAIFTYKEYILYASYERINTEFSKLLTGIGVFRVLSKYYSIIATFMPWIDEWIKNDQEASRMATIIDKVEPKLIPRLAAFYLTASQKGADFVYTDLQRMRYSKKISYQVKDIVSIILQLQVSDLVQIKKILKDYSKSDILTAVTITEIVNYKDLSGLKNDIIQFNNQCHNLKQMQIKGDDLIKLGIKEPIEIKNMLNYLLNEIIEERLPNEKKVLLQKIEEIKKK